MSKSKKPRERSRQAKIMRQKAREKARRRRQDGGPTMDEFRLFRHDLLPDDVAPVTWTRAEIVHDLNGLHPTAALARYLNLMVDPQAMRASDEDTAGYMAMAINLWRMALEPPEKRERRLEELARAMSDREEKRKEFRQFARSMIEHHEAMFPRLHARVARRRLAATLEIADAAEALGTRSAQGRDTHAEFLEFARPLLDAAGEDETALSRALRISLLFDMAGNQPLVERAAFMAMVRETLPPEERAYFDEMAPLMMRRHREMFGEGGIPASSSSATAPVGEEATASEQVAPTATSPDESQPIEGEGNAGSDPKRSGAEEGREATPLAPWWRKGSRRQRGGR